MPFYSDKTSRREGGRASAKSIAIILGTVLVILILLLAVDYRQFTGSPGSQVDRGDPAAPRRYKIEIPEAATPPENGSQSTDTAAPLGKEPDKPQRPDQPESTAVEITYEDLVHLAPPDRAPPDEPPPPAPAGEGPGKPKPPDGYGKTTDEKISPDTMQEEKPAKASQSAAIPPAGDGHYVRPGGGVLREAPNEGASEVIRLVSGEKTTYLDRSGNWYKVATANGWKGWGHRKMFSNWPVGRVDFQASETADLPPPTSGEGTIKGIQWRSLNKGKVEIEIQLDGFFPVKINKIEGRQPRIYCDFPGTRSSPDLDDTITPDIDLLRNIRLGLHLNPQQKLRVVFDLREGSDYSATIHYDPDTTSYKIRIKAIPHG